MHFEIQRNFTYVSFDSLDAVITISVGQSADFSSSTFFPNLKKQRTGIVHDPLRNTGNKLRAIDILIRHRPNYKPILGWQRCG